MNHPHSNHPYNPAMPQQPPTNPPPPFPPPPFGRPPPHQALGSQPYLPRPDFAGRFIPPNFPPQNNWPRNVEMSSHPPNQPTGIPMLHVPPPAALPPPPHPANFSLPPPSISGHQIRHYSRAADSASNNGDAQNHAMRNEPEQHTQDSRGGEQTKYHAKLQELLEKVQLRKASKSTQEETDKNWIADFVVQRKQPSDQHTTIDKTSYPKLCEYRLWMSEALQLQQDLQNACRQLSEHKLDMDETQWEARLTEVQDIKVKLQSLKERLTDKSVIEHIQRRIKAIKQKKRRQAHRRVEREEEDAADEERKKQLHEKLDLWQQSLVEKQQQINREKELKAVADRTLGEVRRKLTEVKRNQQLLTALAKLRQIRKQMINKQGLYTSSDVDTAFEERVQLMNTVLQQRVKVYEAEKKTLEVMLQTEQEESEEKERERKEEEFQKKKEKLKEETMEYLFGKPSSVCMGDVLYPFHHFYEGANHSMDNLIAIRHDWDVNLVCEDDSEGSAMPAGWVTPATPSSDGWRAALEGNS